MGCIKCNSPFLPLQFHHPKHMQAKPTHLPWLIVKVPGELLGRHKLLSTQPLRTRALATSSLVLGLTSIPPTPPNIYVLILTSALFLFLFWITNFVVPNIIMKYLKSKDPNEKV